MVNDATALATFLRDYGPWGLRALSLFGNAWLAGRWKECFEARIADAKAVTEEATRCITNSSQHIAASSAAITNLAGTSERRLAAFEALADQTRRLGEDIRDLRASRP